MTIIEQARARVADRYSQPYHKNAILNGDWDSGSIVQNEVKALEAEQEQCRESDHE